MEMADVAESMARYSVEGKKKKKKAELCAAIGLDAIVRQ